MSDQPIIVAGPTSVTITTTASIVAEDREVAWAAAKQHISMRPDIGWLIGRYLGTDTMNDNGQIFRLGDIEAAHQRVVHTPLNMLHQKKRIVGTYVAVELVRAEPTEAAADNAATAHVEALAAVWRYVHPDEWRTIEEANEAGTLFYSMEAVPKSLTCPTCDGTYPYAGPASETYCEHMVGAGSPKILDDPLFVGGGIVVPPARPGWRNADITRLSQSDQLAEQVAGWNLDPAVAESVMAMLLAGTYRDQPLRFLADIGLVPMS